MVLSNDYQGKITWIGAAITKTRHSKLYYRNTAIAMLAVSILAVAIYAAPFELISLLWLIPLFLLFRLVWTTYLTTHPLRRSNLYRMMTPLDVQLQFKAVEFPARDGLTIAGWFLPSHKRRAIIMAHGLGGAGVTMMFHAHPLVKAGYNVLMVDLRAHGISEGDTIDGVQEVNDILGAVDYLKTRLDVDADKIGVLGISLGAHTVLHAALQTDAIRALILEGVGPTCLEDHGGKPTTLRRKINYPINWLYYKYADLISGTRPESNTSALRRLNRPILVISTGKGMEQYFSRLLFPAASEPKELWEIPQARHAGGFFHDRQAYSERMVAFFDQWLL
jgi:dienelactone hydrolase